MTCPFVEFNPYNASIGFEYQLGYPGADGVVQSYTVPGGRRTCVTYSYVRLAAWRQRGGFAPWTGNPSTISTVITSAEHGVITHTATISGGGGSRAEELHPGMDIELAAGDTIEFTITQDATDKANHCVRPVWSIGLIEHDD